MVSWDAHTAALSVSSNWPGSPRAARTRSGDARWKEALEGLEQPPGTLRQWIIRVGRDLWRSLVQPLAHSRANSKARWDCTGPCPVKLGQFPRMGTPRLPWAPAPVLHHSHREKIFLIKNQIFFFLVATCASCLWSFLCALLRTWLSLFCPLASRRPHLDPSESSAGWANPVPSASRHTPHAPAPDHPREALCRTCPSLSNFSLPFLQEERTYWLSLPRARLTWLQLGLQMQRTQREARGTAERLMPARCPGLKVQKYTDRHLQGQFFPEAAQKGCSSVSCLAWPILIPFPVLSSYSRLQFPSCRDTR